MPLPLYHPEHAKQIHNAALDYAIRVQRAIDQQPDVTNSTRVAGAALMTLAHEMLCLHRATSSVCIKGWAFAAPLMLRAMLEAMCSTLVIVNNQWPDVAAFKYFYSYTKEDLSDPSVDPQLVAAETRANIDIHMTQMTAEDRESARSYLRAPRVGHFWYGGEFAGPTAILRRYAVGEVLDLYRLLSIAAHAGFLGMRMFRDNPDLLDVNPREDLRATGFALVGSSRLLSEGTRERVAFGRFQDDGYEVVMRVIRGLHEWNPE